MDLMSIATIVLKTLDPKECRSLRPLVFVIAAACTLFLLGTVYARFIENPKGMDKVKERITTLELSKATTDEKLLSICASLERIEANSADTRRDVSDLKTALIKK